MAVGRTLRPREALARPSGCFPDPASWSHGSAPAWKEAAPAGHQHVRDGKGRGAPSRGAGWSTFSWCHKPGPSDLGGAAWHLPLGAWVTTRPRGCGLGAAGKPPAGAGAARRGASFSLRAGAGMHAELCGLPSLPHGGLSGSRCWRKRDPSSAPGETQAAGPRSRSEVRGAGCVWLLP